MLSNTKTNTEARTREYIQSEGKEERGEMMESSGRKGEMRGETRGEIKMCLWDTGIVREAITTNEGPGVKAGRGECYAKHQI